MNYLNVNWRKSEMLSRVLTIVIQLRQTKNVRINLWNFSKKKHDMLDSRAITLMNALCKWSVLPADIFTFHMLNGIYAI